MRSQKNQVKSQKSLLFCSLCGFIANSESELDFHYKMSHEEDNDEISEVEFEQIKKESRYDSYQRVCKSGSCIIRRHIELENDPSKIRHLLKDYCLTCDLHSLIFDELKKENKI